MARLTLKDLGATAVVAIVAAISWAYFSDQHWPVVSGPRVVTAIAFLLGTMTCATGSRTLNAKQTELSPFRRFLRSHGAIGFGLAIAGVITGNEIVLIVLLSMIGALWIGTTIRHALGFPKVAV